jgi:hypothetical protein
LSLQEAKGSGVAASEWSASGFEFKQFLPSMDRDDKNLADARKKYGLAFISSLDQTKTWLQEAVKAKTPSGEVLAWISENVDAEVVKDPEFTRLLTEVVLRGLLPPGANNLPSRESSEEPWIPGFSAWAPVLKK